jgi:hypothetical protein
MPSRLHGSPDVFFAVAAPGVELPDRLSKLLDVIGVGKNRNSIHQRVVIIGAEKDNCAFAVAGDYKPLMGGFGTLHDPREVGVLPP